MEPLYSRVAMLVAPKRIELREEAVPLPPPGGITVRIRAALTDGTDLKTYRRGHPKMPMPTRFGHEFSGDVAAVAPDVTAFSRGDAVMCVHTAPCGTCFWCRHAQEELCESIMATMILGAYSDFIAVPQRIVERNCFKKPPDVSYAEGAFLEPLACVVHSVRTLAPPANSVVAVLGNGAFGILHALLLRQEGIDALLFGRRPERVALARELGLESFDTRSISIADAIKERTQGRGADAAIECTGSAEMWGNAPSYVRRGGCVSFFAGLPSESRVSFLAARLHYDEVRLLAPFHFTPADVRAAFDLIAARDLPLRQLLTHSGGLDTIVETFARLDAGEGMKALVEP
ncbi:MAG TPA: alcohol dehydrogenase catalytic domain-containing protein [Candidatus Lustribacter sp.]|jgi:L-iditol 2-dehydrogenase|nr:alcohol dehydrogenase catalytic domain-containing protein [Candidatus Lustribacter sp.]